MTVNYIISFCIVLLIGLIIFTISSIKSRNTYLKYLKVNLPTVAENIINDIIEKKITVEDINMWVWNNRTTITTSETTDLFIISMDYIKNKITDYVNDYIKENVRNKFVAKLLKDLISLDPSIISTSIDTILDSSTKEGKEIYNKLLDVIYNHVEDTVDKIEKEEAKAVEIAEAYENETVEDVAEYDGEFDADEHSQQLEEVEYPDEENLDEIPEELIEIVAGSETEEEIELPDQSDGEELSFDNNIDDNDLSE